MRNLLLAATFTLALVGFHGEAKAQFCPGASGTVFVDVPVTDPFCPAITWIAERGVTLGCQDLGGGQALYCPNDNASRTQMAAFLNRLGNALFPLNCSMDQVMAWNGTMWVCSNSPAGPAGPTGPAGPAGPTGATGPAGPAGAQGIQGDPGPVGPMGPIGATGPQGPAGATGATGAMGPQGNAGADGKTILSGAVAPTSGDGVDGDFFIDTVALQIYGPKAAGAWPAGVSIVGPAGATGATGAQGPVGATGPQGAPGLPGPAGVQGPQGVQGPVGPIGATGPQGVQGPAGPQGPAGSITATTPYRTVTANTTITDADYTVFCDITSNDIDVTLPAATSNGGRIFVIRRIGGGNNECNVAPVQGLTFVLDNGGVARAIVVQSNGNFWYVISQTFQ